MGLLLLPAAMLSACSGASTTPASPTRSTVTASSHPSTTPSQTATPAATPIATACTGGDLNVIFGAASSAAGGEQGMTALVANDSGTACRLSGSLQAQLLTSSGGSLPTSIPTTAPTGGAWLVPDRVALDAVWPQGGEATVTISWHTGDVQPGVCSGLAPTVGELRLSVPGGGTVTGSLTGPLTVVSMAPCKGVIQLGAITQATTPGSFTSPTAGAEQASQEDFAGVTSQGWPPATPTYSVTLGVQAAVVAYDGPDCGAFTYLWQDGAGWHVLTTTCAQASGYTPTVGEYDYVYGPAGSGCADVYSNPSHSSSVVACLASGVQFGQGPQFTVDQGPTYTAETDPTSQQPAGTLWWHLQGQGWVTEDYLVNVVP